MTTESSSLPAPPPSLTPITGDDLRRHCIRHLYAITTSLDPRILLNVIQIGEDQFLQSDLSEDARNLCTVMSQSLQAVDRLLVEGAATDTSNRGYRKHVMLSTDINIQAKNDCWFSDTSTASQKVASEVLRYFTRCVQLQQQTAVEGIELYPIG